MHTACLQARNIGTEPGQPVRTDFTGGVVDQQGGAYFDDQAT